ncbi:MAG TPA: 6,7-dimethyl-8-ribityllumazine synthase [Cyclobacteriaceae bacterium]|nr:6,7-dimethyl-8-ribityllumazine synthase [Cyclobacteriaceae bacterium]
MAGPLKSGRAKTRSSIASKRFALVVADWNEEITNALYEGAVATLLEHGVPRKNIIRKNVPGSFELSLGGLLMARKRDIHAVICLGCVIQGETPHFDYICQAVAYGITQANLITGKPVIFGVLTTHNIQQAEDRAGGKHGNKGEEAALSAIQMLNF